MKVVNNNKWYVDSGATCHMTFELGDFSDYEILDEPIGITTSGNSKIWGMAKGNILLTNDLVVEAVYVPKLKYKILSVYALTELGYEVEYDSDYCEIIKNKWSCLKIPWEKDGYRLERTLDNKATGENYKQCSIPEKINLNLSNELVVSELEVTSEPEDWAEVQNLVKNEKELWSTAMKQELERFNKSKVWTKTLLPMNKKAIGTRWKYKRKPVSNSKNVKLRARLVAQGFSQTYPEEFDDTYAPVIQLATVRSTLKMASDNDMQITHVDIDSAFLYSELDEDIYLKPPLGPWIRERSDTVYKLNKSIYGLKQAAKDWYKRITTSIGNMEFTKSSQDPCLFIRRNETSETWMLLHVDDILIISKDQNYITHVIEKLKQEYSIKVLGDIREYLGMQFVRDEQGDLYMHQEEKIKKLVQKMKILKYDKANTPMKTDFNNIRENNPGEELKDIKEYQSIMGSLLYIANTSRPDISYSVNVLTRHNSCPNTSDMDGANRIVKYLSLTKQMSLRLGNKEDAHNKDLICYSDSDWGGEQSTSKSTSGGLQYLGSSLIGWSCARQKTISLSTTEAEYTAVIEAAKEALWLKDLYKELNIVCLSPLTMKCDNQSCIQLAYSYKVSKRVKHVQMKINFLRELIDKNLIILSYCNTDSMYADILTKPLPSPRFQEIRKHLGLIELSLIGGIC